MCIYVAIVILLVAAVDCRAMFLTLTQKRNASEEGNDLDAYILINCFISSHVILLLPFTNIDSEYRAKISATHLHMHSPRWLRSSAPHALHFKNLTKLPAPPFFRTDLPC